MREVNPIHAARNNKSGIFRKWKFWNNFVLNFTLNVKLNAELSIRHYPWHLADFIRLRTYCTTATRTRTPDLRRVRREAHCAELCKQELEQEQYFLVQPLKIARKEVLVIPPHCLLQNLKGGDSLGFRNAEETLTVLSKPQTSLQMTAMFQSEPFSRQRSNFSLSALHDFSQRNEATVVTHQMIKST